MKQRVLILFSIITSIFSAAVGFMQRFILTLTEVDAVIIFFSGIFLLVIVSLLIYFLVREVIRAFSSGLREKKNEEEKEKEARKRRIARNKNKKKRK